ncbi:hypothetical protein K7432_016063 [Basidiobolus ranarum]|uniref:DNA-directed RNA polymerase n=1 Tax=Basidiobolus ranarum TaxID=34480 RepID=A0ABR2VNA1_9FUNG
MEINLFSDEQILKLADFCLNEHWDIYDSKFGPRTHGDTCTKCKKHCSGHYAYLDIGKYICHPLFTKDLELKLNNMCISCGLNISNPDETKCPECKTKISRNYYVTKDGTVLRKPTSKSSKDSGTKISLDKIRSSLQKNFDRHNNSNLTNYIIRYIIIPPIQTRSPEDPEYMSDFSTKYTRLVNYTKNNDTSNIYHTYSKIVGTKRTEGMGKFFSGKNGIFRDIMLGKRTERSARSVITGDPYLDYNTIFIPKYISDNIRIPIRIHKYNIKHFSKQKNIFFPNGDSPIDDPDLIFINQNYERLLSDNDEVILNRQPSLTSTSVLGFKVKIRKDNIKTISINPLVTPFFNADFDGDEMNIFVIPNIEHEFNMLLEVTNTNPPSPIQDTITGSYLMTLNDEAIPPEIFMDCFLLSKKTVFPKNIRFSGKNLFRLAIPTKCDTTLYNSEIA